MHVEIEELKEGALIGKQVTVTIGCETAEDEAAARRLLMADKAYRALFEIGQEVFRPARKHGYSEPKIHEALEACREGNGEELVGKLEDKFYEILREHNIDLDDC